MIPKTIHYIWLGGKPLPKFIKKCIKSWKKFCPDYEIKRWDESNLNLSDCQFAKDAYDAKKYAFASDFFRFQILYNNGGIYLDTDVELIKPLDDLLENNCFVGFEHSMYVNPGLVFGSTKNNELCKEIINHYKTLTFDIDKLMDNTVCIITSNILSKYGLKREDQTQDLGVCKVYAMEYFCPKKGLEKTFSVTDKTYSIHHFYGSWITKLTPFQKIKQFVGKICRKIIGTENFEKIRKRKKDGK